MPDCTCIPCWNKLGGKELASSHAAHPPELSFKERFPLTSSNSSDPLSSSLETRDAKNHLYFEKTYKLDSRKTNFSVLSHHLTQWLYLTARNDVFWVFFTCSKMNRRNEKSPPRKKIKNTSKLNLSGLCSAPESCQQAEDMTLGCFFPSSGYTQG